MAFISQNGQSRATRVYEGHLTNAEPNELISYEELATTLGVEKDDHKVIGAAVRQAEKWLLPRRKLALICVPTAGYRVTTPEERPALAAKQERHIHRGIRKQRQLVTNVNRSGLAIEVLRKLEDFDIRTSRMEGAIQRIESRNRERDEILKQVVQAKELDNLRFKEIEKRLGISSED